MPRLSPTPHWLAHPLRWQRGPLPWAATARSACGMGPLLAAGVAAGQPGAGALAGLGALFATINDRAGTRRTGVPHIGLPALGGAVGLLAGTVHGWWAVALLSALGLVSGAVSVAGTVSSAAAVQALVLAAVGSGMPLALPGWARAGCYLAGAGWILLLRTALPGNERATVAAVFDALADALEAVGTPGAEASRRRLTAALDRADEALRMRHLLRLPGRPRTDDGLERRFAAAAGLCEAAVALLWEGERLPARSATGPRRLAEAVRSGGSPGALPAPVADTPARTAFDRAVLDAGVAFGTHTGQVATRARRSPGVRPWGPAGREYGTRVAVCVGASAAVALLLRTDHWYWLPVTAAFLVKPDYGPLFSRVVNRFAGTAAGVLLFAAVAALCGDGPRTAVAVAGGAGLLLPLALRNFGAQTAVVTLAVLAFAQAAGDTQAASARLADTVLACAIVLLVGHLPRLTDTRARVGHRSAHALHSTRRYLDHVLAEPVLVEPAEPAAAPAPRDGHDAAVPDPAVPDCSRADAKRAALRRAAYRALAEARHAAETAAAELHTGRPERDWLRLTTHAERIADATTACAVRLQHGATRPAPPTATGITATLTAVADTLDGHGPTTLAPVTAPPGCSTLDDILSELQEIHALAGAPGRRDPGPTAGVQPAADFVGPPND